MPEFFNRFQGRQDLLDFAAEKGIPVVSTKAKPWSMDDNVGLPSLPFLGLIG
jgi:argininosuccinate synthase